jgi:integrase
MNLNMRLTQRKNGIWYVEFERDKYRSLKTKDESEAKKLYQAVRAEYLAGRLAQIRGECTVTVGEFRDEYEKWARDAREHKTFKADMLAMRQLIAHTGESLRLDKLSEKHTDLMIAACKKRGCKPGSINAYIRHIRAMFDKVVAWKILPSNPYRSLSEVPKEKKPPQYIEAKSVASFLGSVTDMDERRILTAYIYSGRRRSELCRLTWADVDFEKEEYFVSKSKAHLSKWYPMHPMFKAVLQAMPQRDGRVFSRWSHPDTITHLAKNALRNAGYPEMNLHKMRHTFATLLQDQGVDLGTIGALLGHTDKRATEIYTHVTDTRQRAAIRLVNAGPIDLIGEQ